jgi:hypothetical protein
MASSIILANGPLNRMMIRAIHNTFRFNPHYKANWQDNFRKNVSLIPRPVL